VWNGIGLQADAETLYLVSKSAVDSVSESGSDAPEKLAGTFTGHMAVDAVRDGW
jgi:hypothetical protein